MTSFHGGVKLEQATLLMMLIGLKRQVLKVIIIGDWIWKVKVVPRVTFFFWKLCHNHFTVVLEIHCRGISVSPLCMQWKGAAEDITHFMWSCLHLEGGM